MSTLSRSDVSEWAGITLRQLDHFGTAGVAAADVGGERKRFSVDEARLAVIAGRCLRYGMTPRALVGPIDWLRKYTRWPTVDLPNSLPEIEMETMLAESLRIIPDSDISAEKKIHSLAKRLYAHALGRHIHFPTYEESKASSEAYQAALTSENITDRSRAADATRRAEQMLAVAPKWSVEDRNQAISALKFELACRGERDMFFHLATGDDTWKTFVDNQLSRIEGEATWLVIDIRTLFRERGALIA